MSSITITDLLAEPNITDEDYADWDIVRKTPIVPRKIVEMIIEKCEKDGATYLGVVGNEALDIKEYAESLLEQFEEDNE